MNINKKSRITTWDRLNKAAFCFYVLATLFMLFFSVSAVQKWPGQWGRISISLACLLPFILVLLWKIPEWVSEKKIKREFRAVPFIIILGFLNILFSDNRDITLKVMALFLMSGVVIYLTSACLLNTKARQTYFLWICWSCSIIFCMIGIFEYFTTGNVYLLSNNSIPAGALLIILLVGPFLLLLNTRSRFRFIHFLIIILIISVICLIGKRGPLLGIGVISLIFCIFFSDRKRWVILIAAILLFGTFYKIRNYFPQNPFNLIGIASSIYRLENYSFAGHVFLKKPLFGTGLHVPLERYLKDYSQKINVIKPRPGSKKGANTFHDIIFSIGIKAPLEINVINFKLNAYYNYTAFIKKDKSFDNILLCGLAETGVLFFIAYIYLIFFLMRDLFSYAKHYPEKRNSVVILLLPLVGFFIHSMTFESLLFPHLNWLFHSYLGLIANFHKI